MFFYDGRYPDMRIKSTQKQIRTEYLLISIALSVFSFWVRPVWFQQVCERQPKINYSTGLPVSFQEKKVFKKAHFYRKKVKKGFSVSGFSHQIMPTDVKVLRVIRVSYMEVGF